MLHPLLASQINKYFGSVVNVPPGLINFFDEVSHTHEALSTEDVAQPSEGSLPGLVTISSPRYKRYNAQHLERVQKEKKLEEHLRELFDSIETVLFSADMQKICLTHISAGCEKIYGYTAKEFYDNDNLWEDVVFPEDRPILFLQYSNLRKGKSVRNHYRIINKDKTIRWIENKILPVLDVNGKLLRIDGVIIDRTESVLSEKRVHEQKLLLSETKYRKIFENNPMPMWLLEVETLKFLDVNRAAITHYGYSKEEFLSMTEVDLRPLMERNQLLMYDHTSSGNLKKLGCWKHVTKKGDEIIMEISVDVIEFEARHVRLVLAHDVTERLKSEQSLKESNERYELVTKATNDAIWDWDLGNNELYWSEGYEKMFGYKNANKAININSWTTRIHPEDLDRISQGIMKKINDRDTDFWEDEYRYIKADGSIAYIHDRGFIIYQNNTPVRMVGAMQDITKRKIAEENLHNSQTNLLNILENTDTAYFLLDENARIVSYNKLAKDLANMGITGEIFIGLPYVSILPAKRKKEVEAAINTVINEKHIVNYDVKQEMADKTSVWLHVCVHPIIKRNKELIGLSVAISNITERKMAEQLLQESEANLRTIVDNTSTSYILLDKNFKIVSFNQCALIGYKQELGCDLAKGENIIDYLPDERKKITSERYEQVLKGKKLNYEVSFDQPDGSVNWYNMNVFPVYGTAQVILGFVVSAEDITKRKNIELEREKITTDLLQRNQTLEQFAYIISHNLRAPVANITGLSTILLNTPNLSVSDFARCMQGLALSVKKLDEVIIDLNYILQVRGQVSAQKEKVKFSSLVSDIKTSLSGEIEKEKITLRTNFSAVNEFFGLKSYLTSIFYNLISNSIKYRNPREKLIIDIKSELNNGKLRLYFNDNGLGIDMETHGSKIFGLYRKFHTHIEGKGMGLYMVKTQVEILGGKIFVSSEVNKGTEFNIVFNQ